MDDDLGTIEAGKIADLVILRGNPLQDMRNTRNVRTVFMDGVSHDAQALLASVNGSIGPTGPDDLDAYRAKAVPPPGGD